MSYVINFDGLNIPVENLEVNRVPQFSFFWGTFTKDLVGVIHGEKWDANDPNVDYFQVTFTTHNTKSVLTKVIENFSNGNVFSIQTPLVSFSHAIIQNASIDNDQISVSLLAKNPTSKVSGLKSDVCLALEANYYNSQPNFIQVFQFGNYIAISTYPFKLNRSISNGKKVFENNYWTVFQLPISERPIVIPYQVGKLQCYCYTNLPPLMTPVVVQPSQTATQYTYAFGVHQSCELSAYLKVEDLRTGEIWYQPGNTGNIDLAPGSYKLTPIVVIPETTPQIIEGESTTVYIPTNKLVLGFLSPLTIPIHKPLRFYAYENLVLHFKGWKSFEVPANTVIDIYFDYPGTFECQVYSLDRNAMITTFSVKVFDTKVTSYNVDYIIRVGERIISNSSRVSSNLDSYVVIDNAGQILGYPTLTNYIVSDSLITSESKVNVEHGSSDYMFATSSGTLIDSSQSERFMKSIDVCFHDIPMVGKPVLVSVDGPIKSITFEGANVTSLSDSLYKVEFLSEGLKTIAIELTNGNTITKHVMVNPGFRKIVTATEDGQVTCTTGDYWVIVQSPTAVRLVAPNSSITWTEYGFGPTDIKVTLIKGSKSLDVQYRFNIYNPNALQIAVYDRTLQLLHLPTAEIDFVNWYIDGGYVGTGTDITIPPYISGGSHTIKAVVYSNNRVIELTETGEISGNNANRIQLSCQIINPLRVFDMESTNRLVTIYNGKPEVNYRYLDTSLNIRLTKYLYLERYTYVGTINDLEW